ncbi:hypothetical protein EST38_g14418 [Candolleomyces aberdarensis]|uniref:Uncharacterized protein n=1 Tax=Candolleomyces aberdarensis TaxID=2316362 RepID=A0A4V1Q1F8_9AGAR|nr:hypothetical protein EST38_g14418 [Candolleomyces aberdarensis]
MHRKIHPEFHCVNSAFKIFGKLPVFTTSPDEHLDIFTRPLPARGKALQPANSDSDDLEDAGVEPVYGYDGVLQLFGEATERWVNTVQALFDSIGVDERSAKSGTILQSANFSRSLLRGIGRRSRFLIRFLRCEGGDNI